VIGEEFSFVFKKDTFTDEDITDELTYTIEGLPEVL
jgi:hypothetical protein